MASIAEALTDLGITEWVLRGEPTNETEFREMFSKVTGADENGSAIESTDPTQWGFLVPDVFAKQAALTAAEPLKLLREERNKRLAETDWWASSDLNMSDARANYRQALRDITHSYTSLAEVNWPSKPE